MTRLVDTMERHGLVKRTSNENDRRQKRIVLTEKGRKMYGRVVLEMRRCLSKVEKTLSPHEVIICKKVLCQVYTQLTQMNM